MPNISTEDNHLTVLNLFTTDLPENQESLLQEMRKIVDSAAFEGWQASTVHAGVDKPGTANFIQWRSGEDLERRYAADEFKHRTLPVFGEITTSIRLLQNEIAHTLRHPSLGGVTEISPTRDDYTVIAVYTVAQEQQQELVTALGPGQDWLLEVAGFRSQSVLRGLRARGLEGSFAVTYAQWESKEAYDAFRAQPQDQRSARRRENEALVDSLALTVDWNTYRVVHTRSAGQ